MSFAHEFKWLSIKDRVSGWGQSFVSPPPPTYRVHCWSHVDAELCVILPCYFSVKGHRNLFPTFFPLPCPHVLLFGLLVPHLYNIMYWAENFYVANVVKVPLINLFCTQVYYNKIKAGYGVSQSHFHPYGICVLIAC